MPSKLKKAIDALKSSIDVTKPFSVAKLYAKWNEVWPVLQVALENLKDSKWTSNTVDAAIDDIIKAGKKVSDPESLKKVLEKLMVIIDRLRKSLNDLTKILPGLFPGTGNIKKFLDILDWVEAGLKG